MQGGGGVEETRNQKSQAKHGKISSRFDEYLNVNSK